MLLRICCKMKDSKLDYKCLAWLKYPCTLKSLASNPPFTWPTTNLESENASATFPPIFWIMAILTYKVSYSALLFVAEKPKLKDFSIVILSGDTTTSPTTDPFWLTTPSTYNFQVEVPCREIVSTSFPPKFYSSFSISTRDSVNSAIKSTRTWLLIEVWGIYLMLNAPKTGPHLAILLV